MKPLAWTLTQCGWHLYRSWGTERCLEGRLGRDTEARWSPASLRESPGAKASLEASEGAHSTHCQPPCSEKGSPALKPAYCVLFHCSCPRNLPQAHGATPRAQLRASCSWTPFSPVLLEWGHDKMESMAGPSVQPRDTLSVSRSQSLNIRRVIVFSKYTGYTTWQQKLIYW